MSECEHDKCYSDKTEDLDSVPATRRWWVCRKCFERGVDNIPREPATEYEHLMQRSFEKFPLFTISRENGLAWVTTGEILDAVQE